jgi:lipopolysaccharide transport system permease protein
MRGDYRPRVQLQRTSTEPAGHSRLDTTRIAPSHGWVGLDLGELWQSRELIAFLAWRDISVRYKQTLLGGLWAVLQPFMLMVVFTIVFGVVAKVPSGEVPYPVFAYAGLLPWQLFAFALTEASISVVANERLITKVYFPRLVIPISAVAAGLVDFAASLGLFVALALIFQVVPGPMWWLFPIFVAVAFATALGVGLWLSALNVRYRDVRYTLPFLTQLWLLATPIAYPSSLIPEPWRAFLALNPMAGVVEGFRWCLLGGAAPAQPTLLMSGASCVVLLITGLLYFRKVERTFADVI